MLGQITILFFAAFLFVAQATPLAADDDVTEEVARNVEVDLNDLSKEELQELVQQVKESFKRAVDEMDAGQVEMVDDPSSLQKRMFKNWSLGRGWSAGTSGLSWDRGNHHFNIKPTMGGGFRAGYTFRF